MTRNKRVDRLKRELPSASALYRDRLEKILPYISDNMALHRVTDHQKKKVRQYYNLIFGTPDTPPLKSSKKRVYRPSNKANLEKAKIYSGTPPGFKDLEVAFIPETGPRSKVRFTKDSMDIITGSIHRKNRFFDTRQIIKAAREASRYRKDNRINKETFDVSEAEYIDDAVMGTLISQIDKMTAGDPAGLYYQIMCGDNYFPGHGGKLDRESLINTLKWMMVKYDNNVHKWLGGITVFSFRDQVGKVQGFNKQYSNEEFKRYANRIDDRIVRNRAKAHAKKKRKRS